LQLVALLVELLIELSVAFEMTEKDVHEVIFVVFLPVDLREDVVDNIFVEVNGFAVVTYIFQKDRVGRLHSFFLGLVDDKLGSKGRLGLNYWRAGRKGFDSRKAHCGDHLLLVFELTLGKTVTVTWIWR
jgi:hypothetical protein